ncbi:MAG: hypothetical protein A4E61_00589 [Syntrophorhabdus sp. PtaB.Bin184]|jgi:hypothetical protein|nr:MAG: hypothetical protein A4E61_00589 [Syntrophorhabdus sp. PtaB.Bin184]
MAKRSLSRVSCCMFLLLLVSGSLSPLVAQTKERIPGPSSDGASSITVNALSRQIAFVKSFSAVYPCQFRQGQAATGPGTIAVDDLKARGK